MPNLVGIGKEQVPTNAMLGGLAYQDSVGEIDIDKIKAKISDTAVDIFVYDTHKDSDGGAWRHRTQNTSWYNEDANTDRSTRKEFPAVAVIVAENDILTIYDGDDPNLPMWMIFRAGGNNGHQMIGRTNEHTTSIHMLNGLLCVGRDYFGLHMINFIADRARFKESGYDTPYTLPIGTNRNGGNTWIGANVDGNDIVNDLVNDVAMTVLPNAPIDDATGLPVPTIAVATDGGVSVIKDDGIVVDLYRTNDDDVHHVDLDGDRVIMFMELGGVYTAKIPNADQSGNPNGNWSVYGTFSANTSGVDYPKVQGQGAGVDLVSMKDHTFATAGWNGTWENDETKGLSILAENILYSGNGMVAWIQSDFNTGYMFGNIKGAYLSDTNSDNLTSTNLVSNGTFTSNISGWSGSATLTHDSGRLKLVSTSGNQTSYTTVTCEVGKKYYFQADFQGHVSFHVSIQNDAGNDVGYIPYQNYGSSTTVSCFFTATATTMYLVPYVIHTNSTGYVDNVICHLADHDRSVNGGKERPFSGTNGLSSGLKVNGTITRAPVATGAELVYYGGFSNTNYFSQPYNSALDFGTGDFCIMFWMKNTQNDAYDDLIHRRAHNGSAYTGTGWFLQMGNDQNITVKDSATGGSRAAVDADSVHGVWRHICFVRRSNHGYAYKDGKPQSTNGDNEWTENLDNSSAILTIGRATNSGDGDADKSFLSLVRISAGAPSEEQIKRIFNDEKHLFNENAKCTLYGTSNQVEAVAYDDSNDILHAGTSSGRSEFQGLSRINNTTTAVTTAISASNGLVAEQ